MNFLPIAERELRLMAGKPLTYYVRSLTALGAMLLGTVMVLLSFGGTIRPTTAGQTIFATLSLALYVGVCLEGAVSAADCLSREKREDTLGLLFLANLKGYDVVAGKLVSSLAHSLYCTLGTLPAMAFCFLLGGLSMTDFGRMLVALPNTLFFAAALGLLISACHRSESRAISVAVLAIFAFSVGWPALGFTLKTTAGIAPLFLVPSPAGAFVVALGAGFSATPGAVFGWSLLVTQLLAWGFLALASYILPRSFQDKTVARIPVKQSFPRLGRNPAAVAQPKSRWEWSGELHSFLRQRTQRRPAGTLLLLVGIATLTLVGAMWLNPTTWFEPDRFAPTVVLIVMLLHQVLKYVAAAQACRALLHDRQGGELELLLTTPLGADELLRGHLLALKRQLLWPLLAVLGLDLLLLLAGWCWLGLWELLGLWVFLGFETAWLLMNLYTLTWVGLWQGLKCQTHGQALRRTVVWVLALPWLGLVLTMLVVGVASAGRGLNDNVIWEAVIWFLVLLIGCNCEFAGRAMNELHDHFRRLAAHQTLPDPPPPQRKWRAWLAHAVGR